jgi:hypothetical protein
MLARGHICAAAQKKKAAKDILLPYMKWVPDTTDKERKTFWWNLVFALRSNLRTGYYGMAGSTLFFKGPLSFFAI